MDDILNSIIVSPSTPPPSGNMVSADDYERMTQVQHILAIPDTYIGSTSQIQREELVYHKDEKKFINSTISVPYGLERLYLEILSNASDNVTRSRQRGVPVGKIQITMTDTTITIRNEGIHVPVAVNTQTGLYAPEMIFANLLTSSNYSGDRYVCGRNGFGAKLTNIYSSDFKVTCADPENKLIYSGQWINNMSTKASETITSHSGAGFTEISFSIELVRFGYLGEYDAECSALFMKHAADAAFTTKVDVHFNGENLGIYKNADKYAVALFGVDTNHFVYRQYPPNVETVADRHGTLKSKDSNIPPTMELIVADTPDNGGLFVPFVNSMITRDGGVHVNTSQRVVFADILTFFNKEPKDSKKVETNKITLKPGDIKPHLSFALNYWAVNPTFSSQSKTKLDKPSPSISIPSTLISLIKKWEVMNRLRAVIDLKRFNEAKKSDGGKKKDVNVAKSVDANRAGTTDSKNCVLFLCEGDSASSYVLKWIGLVHHGRDKYGYYAMRGVPLNVMNADPDQVAENREICSIKKLIGLREGFDYTDPAIRETLRYGQVWIISDSDVDGKHILGLDYLIFSEKWKSLAKLGFIKFVRTPIIRVSKGQTRISFYTEGEYLQWEHKTPDFTTWTHKYFKGLGSSSDKDVKDDFKNWHLVSFVHDSKADESMMMAFHKDRTDQRKEWIDKYSPNIFPDDLPLCTVTEFIDIELVTHAFENMVRCIPGPAGLKPGQTKSLFAALSRPKKDRMKEIKVAQMAAFVAQHTAYKHNEKCLSDTLINMAQHHIGSNNMPMFSDEGQFGTRFKGGTDSADARYIFTFLTWWVEYVFRKEDKDILEMVIDEGEKQEPKTYLPIIPINIVNGSKAVATGWSSYIAPHNPLDIIIWFKQRLLGLDVPQLTPWYRDHTGEIKLLVSVKSKNIDRFVSYGKFVDRGTSIHVTELPVQRWTQKYEEMLKKWKDDKIITDFTSYSDDSKVDIVIYGMVNPTMDKLKLIKKFSMSNMVVLDEDYKPHRYTNTKDLMESFYQFRLPHYSRRKQHILTILYEKISERSKISAFIKDVVSNVIEVFRQKKSYIFEQMDQHKHERGIFSKVKLEYCTEDYLEEYIESTRLLVKEFEDTKFLTPESMWMKELDEFEMKYCSHYGCLPRSMEELQSEIKCEYDIETISDTTEDIEGLDDIVSY
jgi:DNA topoisomerase-2